jgi:hypothetical protein
MAQLTALVDKLLTNASSQYIPDGHICEEIFPVLQVIQKTGLLGKYSLSHLRVENTFVGGRGKFRRVETNVRTSTGYSIESHGLEELVTDDDYKNVELPFEAEQDAVIGLSNQIWIEKEQILATALSATGTLTQNATLSGTSQLSDYDNSNPLGVFSDARKAIKDGCGKAPDTAWFDWRVKNKLRYHPQLLDQLGFKWDKPGGLNDQDLAVALDVKKVLVADVDYNSSKEGQADALAGVWGKNIWFGVCPDTAAIRQVSGGYMMGYKGQSPRKVYKYPVYNPPESTAILVKDEYQFLLSNVAALYLIVNAIA